MRWTRILAIVLLLVITATGVFVFNLKNEEIKQLHKEIDILTEEVNTVENNNTDINNMLIEAGKEIKILADEIKLLNETTDEQKSMIISYENEEKLTNEEVLNYLEVLNEPISFLYDNSEGAFYYMGSEIVNSSYSIEYPMSSLRYIYKYLVSFRKLTEITEKDLNEDQKVSIGNLDWATQVLGFYNHMISVEGGIRDLEFILAQLEFELSIKKFEDNEIDINSINEVMTKYSEVKASYEEFINNATKGD